jgi:hypothetical protein
MHHIELIGSYTTVTSHGGEEIRITTTKKDPIPVLCRKLIEHGVPSSDTAQVTRGGMSVFKRDRTIGSWAGIDIVDSDTTGLRTVAYRPFDGF